MVAFLTRVEALWAHKMRRDVNRAKDEDEVKVEVVIKTESNAACMLVRSGAK